MNITRDITRSAFGLVALLLLATISQAAGPRRALLIGNDGYPGANRLDSCINDAKGMATWLTMGGYKPDEIALLTDAKRAQAIAAFESLVEAVRREPHEQVVIYYSGHGITLADDDGDEGPDDPSEEALVFVDHPSEIASLEEMFVRDDKIHEVIREIRANTRQTVVIMDCCYAGGNLKAINPLDPFGKPKRISIPELELLARQAGQTDTRVLQTPEAGRTKAVSALAPGTVPKGLSAGEGAGSLLFIASSNQYQTSRAGNPRSAFTEAFLNAVGQRRHQLSSGDGVLTVGTLQRDLTRELTAIPQTPIFVAQGLDKDPPLIPGMFSAAAERALEELLQRALLELIALDPANQRQEAKLNAELTVPSPIKVGTRFSIRCRPNQNGYIVALTVSPSGTVRFVFPNRYRPDNRVTKDREIQIPYREGLLIQPPVGVEEYHVFLLERNPFEGFDFGQYGKDLIVGNLDDITERVRVNGKVAERSFLKQALTRALVIEPNRLQVDADRQASPPALRFEVPAYGWNLATTRVQSVE